MTNRHRDATRTDTTGASALHRDSTDFKTRGIAPAQQARSKATFNALIEAGLAIFETKDFAATPIGEIAATAGVSVGAFYERFSSKDVYFTALQEIVADRVESSVHRCLDNPSFADLDAQQAIGLIARTWLAQIRAHRGLIRASLRYLPQRAEVWFPILRLGQNMTNIYVDVLRARMPGHAERQLEENTRIAIQFVHGLIVNMILNDPGPLRLDDPKVALNMCRVVSLLVGLGDISSTDNAVTKTPAKRRSR